MALARKCKKCFVDLISRFFPICGAHELKKTIFCDKWRWAYCIVHTRMYSGVFTTWPNLPQPPLCWPPHQKANVCFSHVFQHFFSITACFNNRGVHKNARNALNCCSNAKNKQKKSRPEVVWLRVRPSDRIVAGSIPESTDFLTNSSGQASNALVSLFTAAVKLVQSAS